MKKLLALLKAVVTAWPTWATAAALAVPKVADDIGSAFPGHVHVIVQAGLTIAGGLTASVVVLRRVETVAAELRGVLPHPPTTISVTSTASQPDAAVPHIPRPLAHPRALSLGRRQHFDIRSRSFPVRAAVASKTPRSYTWECGVHLDQGQTSECVGFSWAHELAAKPVVIPVKKATADGIYHLAQTLDDQPGTNYDGTSVLAGAKAVQQDGYLGEYRWAFNLDDLILALGHLGPAVLGVNWREAMFTPDPDGLLHTTGAVAGGHAILATGVNIATKRVRLHNSWGTGWGQGGDAFIGFDDLAALLKDQGEACIPMRRLVGTA